MRESCCPKNQNIYNCPVLEQEGIKITRANNVEIAYCCAICLEGNNSRRLDVLTETVEGMIFGQLLSQNGHNSHSY